MENSSTTRRGFLKRMAFLGAAVMALPLLRSPIVRANQDPRPIPPDLPGAGSIFQPRNDTRRQR